MARNSLRMRASMCCSPLTASRHTMNFSLVLRTRHSTPLSPSSASLEAGSFVNGLVNTRLILDVLSADPEVIQQTGLWEPGSCFGTCSWHKLCPWITGLPNIRRQHGGRDARTLTPVDDSKVMGTLGWNHAQQSSGRGQLRCTRIPRFSRLQRC
jgi:hypothetical protein